MVTGKGKGEGEGATDRIIHCIIENIAMCHPIVMVMMLCGSANDPFPIFPQEI